MKRDDRLTIVSLSPRSRGLFIRMSDPTCAQKCAFRGAHMPIQDQIVILLPLAV